MLHSHGYRATVLCMIRRRLLRPDQLGVNCAQAGSSMFGSIVSIPNPRHHLCLSALMEFIEGTSNPST